MRIATIIIAILAAINPGGKTFLEQISPRDSVLIADQLRYGVLLEDFQSGNGLALPDLSVLSNDTLSVIGSWQLDTLVGGKAYKTGKKLPERFDLRASIVIAPFEAGEYHLPQLPVIISTREGIDSLLYEGAVVQVKTIPIDTTTFVFHDIKGPVRYPITFAELAPWILGGLALIALLVLLIILINRLISRRKGAHSLHTDPPHIVALRSLERFRSDKYWAADKQKIFYSGVTDTLKEYIDARFGVDAPEMTTAELFDAISSERDIDSQMYGRLKELFETADYVKFAKHTVDDATNASVLPLAVSFVTSTYQAQVERETTGEEAHKEA